MTVELESDRNTHLNSFPVSSLKINATKTQIMILGTWKMLWNIPIMRTKVSYTIVSETRVVTNIGAYLDIGQAPHLPSTQGAHHI